MKCSEKWLREWVNPDLSLAKIGQSLTMAGIEVEGMAAVAESFTHVLIAEIKGITPHPQAEQLHICQVDAGGQGLKKIVCGAPNVKVGIKVPLALINAKLPNGMTIHEANIQGEPSYGMLCSAKELGLADDQDGILVLPMDAPLGMDVWEYFQLTDQILDVAITPNRGDCLSVRGLARELAAITCTPMTETSLIKPVAPCVDDKLSITVIDKLACPRYLGRIIRKINTNTLSPIWLKERLRRSGIRSISPIVDVTNYVMLELGQPMHAFDLNTIAKSIFVRPSKVGERITLLDDSEKVLDHETLIIADQEKPLAIAGVMGGMASSVTATTGDIFLESAFFAAEGVAKARQCYQLTSDSAFRFERGVDPTIQCEAIERATELIVQITGGEPGPVVEWVDEASLPKSVSISITSNKVSDVLGVPISTEIMQNIFTRLQFSYQKDAYQGFQVGVPPYRFDIALEEDIIEEIARLYGYDHIPFAPLKGELAISDRDNNACRDDDIKQIISNHGYFEIISYSLIKRTLQELLDPLHAPRVIVNPITEDMTVMRTNMWPGLMTALLYNKSRQQQRIRLFELGTCFISEGESHRESVHIGGVAMGLAHPEQWGIGSRMLDFYDMKGDVESILSHVTKGKEFIFKPDNHPVLHPGQTAGIYWQGKRIGVLGGLHPKVMQTLDLNQKVYVFDIDWLAIQGKSHPSYQEISKFPEIRRDIAIIVNDAIPAKDIQDTIFKNAGDWLKEVFIFDVYQGKGIAPGFKSIALAMILQHPSRTLVDDEVAKLIDQVIAMLKGQLGAQLRS